MILPHIAAIAFYRMGLETAIICLFVNFESAKHQAMIEGDSSLENMPTQKYPDHGKWIGHKMGRAFVVPCSQLNLDKPKLNPTRYAPHLTRSIETHRTLDQKK